MRRHFKHMHQQQIRAIPSLIGNSKDFISNSRSKIQCVIWCCSSLALPSVNFRQKDRKDFDEMCDIPRNYVSAFSNSVLLVPLHPVIISILFYHYKELKECIAEVEQIMMEVTATVNQKQVLKKKKREWKDIRSPFNSEVCSSIRGE
jgi:hypothetical protein